MIFVNDKFCFCNDDIKMPLDFRTQLNIDNFTPRIKITFATPLHIKTNNVFVRDDSLVLRDMFSFIHKRKLAIFCKESELLPQFSTNLISTNLTYIRDCLQKQSTKGKYEFGRTYGRNANK